MMIKQCSGPAWHTERFSHVFVSLWVCNCHIDSVPYLATLLQWEGIQWSTQENFECSVLSSWASQKLRLCSLTSVLLCLLCPSFSFSKYFLVFFLSISVPQKDYYCLLGFLCGHFNWISPKRGNVKWLEYSKRVLDIFPFFCLDHFQQVLFFFFYRAGGRGWSSLTATLKCPVMVVTSSAFVVLMAFPQGSSIPSSFPYPSLHYSLKHLFPKCLDLNSLGEFCLLLGTLTDAMSNFKGLLLFNFYIKNNKGVFHLPITLLHESSIFKRTFVAQLSN